MVGARTDCPGSAPRRYPTAPPPGALAIQEVGQGDARDPAAGLEEELASGPERARPAVVMMVVIGHRRYLKSLFRLSASPRDIARLFSQTRGNRAA